MNRCEICDCEIKEGWPVSCLHCVGDKDATGFFDLHKENKRLREVLDKVMEWYDHGITWAHGEGALEGDDYRDALDAGDAARAGIGEG